MLVLMTDLGAPVLQCVPVDREGGMLLVTVIVWTGETLQALYCPGL